MASSILAGVVYIQESKDMDIRDIDKLEQAKLLLKEFVSNLPEENRRWHQFYPSLSQNRHRARHAIRLIDEILKEKTLIEQSRQTK